MSDNLKKQSYNLYKVILNNLTESYVVSFDLNRAYGLVRKYYEDNNLGFVDDRGLKSIELVAEGVNHPECGIQLFLDSEGLFIYC